MDPQQIEELERTVADFARPVLSMYATINPGREETSPAAVRARVKNTLRELDDLSDDMAQAVLEWFERHTPESRSVALFADGQHLEVLEMELELSEDAGGDRLIAKLGEPYFTPLRAALSEHRPSVVALATRDRLRVFHVFMGEIETLYEVEREPIAEEQDELDQSKNRFPAGVRNVNPVQARSAQTGLNRQNRPKPIADRGDAAVQLAHEHIADSQLRFYQESGRRLEQEVRARGVEHVVLMGPDRDAHRLLGALPGEVKKRVKAVAPGLPDASAAASAVLEAVRPKLAEVEQARTRALLDLIAEEGTTGAERCLRELQEGRLHTLVVPRTLSRHAFADGSGRYLALTPEQAAAFDAAGRAVEVDLAQRLPEVAESWGAELEFVNGEAQKRLIERFDGMAGLRRW